MRTACLGKRSAARHPQRASGARAPKLTRVRGGAAGGAALLVSPSRLRSQARRLGAHGVPFVILGLHCVQVHRLGRVGGFAGIRPRKRRERAHPSRAARTVLTAPEKEFGQPRTPRFPGSGCPFGVTPLDCSTAFREEAPTPRTTVTKFRPRTACGLAKDIARSIKLPSSRPSPISVQVERLSGGGEMPRTSILR